jgi:enamine deaminase RidA (YjgF/YER057c/UK114 family)
LHKVKIKPSVQYRTRFFKPRRSEKGGFSAMQTEEKLKKMGFTLPPAPRPVAAYVPGLREGNLLYVSGQLPLLEGKLVKTGRVGQEVTPEEAYQAARQCTLNGLSVIRDLVGDLDQIEQVVKLVGFIASAPDFFGQPQVVNGASEFLSELLGEAGKHARSAVGVAALPLNAPVEVELIVRVK